MNALASAARTTSGRAAIAISDAAAIARALAFLNVTAASAAGGDTLNVYLQSSLDGGVTFDDFISFTQVLGNGGAKAFKAVWLRDAAPTTQMAAQKDGTLTAGVVNGPVGPTWYVKWTIVGTGSFTFGLALLPSYGR